MSRSPSLNLFTSHPRLWRDNRYVYPVISRRSHGLSIGVNLNPDKVCNFDCIYCSVDRTVPSTIKEVDLAMVREELEALIRLLPNEIWKIAPFDQTPESLRRFNDVAFSGDGEPTSYPGFGSACRLVVDVLDRLGWLESTKIVLITNATLFHQPDVDEALRFLDQYQSEIWAKLEAGTEEYYRMIERTKIPLSRVLANILAAGRVRPIVIQSLFMNVHGQPAPAGEIGAYVQRLRELRDAGCQIKLVQVYTVARQTAESYVTPLEPHRLDSIREQVRALGFNAQSFYGPT
jgi:wyosine [tRNA(Phe)-imidazoG37] synthetase (radical SAM superfamily)